MPISYNSGLRVFRLDTPRTTYLMGLVENENFLGHIYYGPGIPDDDMRYLLRLEERPFTPGQNPGERASFYDAFPFEYPAWGGGSFREPCLRLRDANGGGNCELFYESHRIFRASPGWRACPPRLGQRTPALRWRSSAATRFWSCGSICSIRCLRMWTPSAAVSALKTAVQPR